MDYNGIHLYKILCETQKVLRDDVSFGGFPKTICLLVTSTSIFCGGMAAFLCLCVSYSFLFWGHSRCAEMCGDESWPKKLLAHLLSLSLVASLLAGLCAQLAVMNFVVIDECVFNRDWCKLTGSSSTCCLQHVQLAKSLEMLEPCLTCFTAMQ